MKQWDAVWLNTCLVTCEDENSFMQEAALAVKDGKIAWLGKMSDLPMQPEFAAESIYEAKNTCITPGLIDCHTHLVFAGNRAHEFKMRLEGVSYEEIARQGGGIQSTVQATREASEEALFHQSLPRAQALMASGVTTLEIKSGYGLDLATEMKLLRVAKRIGEVLPITVHSTFLGAHTTPLEFRDNPDAYIDYVCEEMLPVIAKEKLANAVDVFCEKIAFNLAQTEKVFKTAREYGLAIKCHAEQLSDSGGAALAANYQALSVDHLEYASNTAVAAMATAGTTAVLLPGAFYFLREKQLPPIELLREYNVPMALASDCNPGTSPVLSLLIILNLACTLFRLTPGEALLGVTKQAAKALGIADTHGTLATGKAADFAVWHVKTPAELAYYLGGKPLHQLVKDGVVILEPAS